MCRSTGGTIDVHQIMMPPPSLPSDRQLLDAARRGDDAAWAELVQRHRSGVEDVVGSGRSSRRRVDAALIDARVRLVGAAAPEGTPDIRAVRPAMIASVTDGFYGPRWPGVLPSDAGTPAPPLVGDDELLALAFATLPEPWQTALWHRHVEGAETERIAPLVGRSEAEVPELIQMAERGLVDAFFREYGDIGPFGADAAAVVPLLAGFHAGTLSEPDRATIHEHLKRDRIAIADPPAPSVDATEDLADELSAGRAAPAPLAPPSVRRHDAVDSRRLLDLVGSLSARLPAAIAPGVLTMSSSTSPTPAPAVVPAASADETESGDRRRGVIAVLVAGLLVVGVVGLAMLVRGGSDGDDGGAAGTNPSGTLGEPPRGTVDPEAPADGGGSSTSTDPSTTIALRPDALGPLNTISVQLVGADGPLGFAPASAPAGVSLSASSPAPVFAGGSATIDLAIANAADAETSVGVTFELPRGIRFDAGDGDGVLCDDPEDASPRCLVAVPAGASTDVAIRFLLETSIVGRLQIEGDVVDEFVTPISVTPDLVHNSVGRGDVVVIGNTVTRCAPSAARAVDIDCTDVATGTGGIVNRWDVPIEFVGAAPQFSLFNSSSATLTIPEDSTVVAAHLYWSGDLDERGSTIPDDGRNTTIALGLPGGDVSTIEAGRVVLGDVDASQYLGSNDVTELVRAGGAGEYTVGNVQTVEVQGSYGAWALVVVFDDDDEPRRQRVVTRPFEWVAPEDEFGEIYAYETSIPVPDSLGLTAQLDVFALEGELGFEPERFVVGGQVVGGGNPFDSSIEGERSPDAPNSLGVDIDSYDLEIDATDGSLPLLATSEKDGVRIAVLGLTVDLPS